MKKLTFAIALLTCSAGAATAQTGKIELGAQGGASVVSLWGNDILAKSKATAGFSGGLFVQYNLLDYLAIRVDPGFERKGSLMNLQGIDQNGNSVGQVRYYTNLDYLTLPVLVRFSFGDKIRFFANAGPYAAYLASASQVTRGDKTFEKHQGNMDNFRRYDFGITSGAGITATVFEKIALSLEIRNSLGLTDISTGPVVNNGKIHTNSTGLLAGVAWKI